MGKGIIRVKAKAKGGNTSVKIMAKHDMETGNRKDNKGGKIPARYIQTMIVSHKGKTVMEAYLGTAVSRNPYMAFTFAGGVKGETLDITWIENTGHSGTETAHVR